MSLTRTQFGQTSDGTIVDLFTLSNSHGMAVKIATFGAIVTEIHVPDRSGTIGNVVLGFDNLQQYLAAHPFFGAIAGRVANRIAGATFDLAGQTHTLQPNNGPNNLHSGPFGIDKRVWAATPALTADGPQLRLSVLSPAGDGGFPGNLSVSVVYTLSAYNALRIDYHAVTDGSTLCNLTNHSYFNLAGADEILDHELTIHATHYLPVDATAIPTGERRAVAGTPFDFTTPHAIGARIAQISGGYDHNFCLNSPGGSLALAARVSDPRTGRWMEVLTTQPGVQLYTGNFLDGNLTGIGGTYRKYAGFCLECQHWPDAIHHPAFPSVVLDPGQEYREATVYRFGAG